jgi:hypothetical protein
MRPIIGGRATRRNMDTRTPLRNSYYSYSFIMAAPRESVDWFEALIDDVISGES